MQFLSWLLVLGQYTGVCVYLYDSWGHILVCDVRTELERLAGKFGSTRRSHISLACRRLEPQ